MSTNLLLDKNYSLSEKLGYFSAFIYLAGTAFSISLAELGAFLILIAAVWMRVTTKKSFPDALFVNYALGALLIWSAFALLLQDNIQQQVIGLKHYWRIFIPFFLVYILAERKLNRLTDLWLLVGSVHAGYAIIKSFTGITLIPGEDLIPYSSSFFNANGFFSHHLTFGGVYLLTWPFFLAKALDSDSSVILRVLAWLGTLLTLTALFLTLGRSIWLGLIIQVIVLSLFLIRIKLLRLALIGFILLASVVFTMFGEEILKPLGSSENPMLRRISTINLSHTLDRVFMWEAATRAIKEAPIAGSGSVNNEILKSKYLEISAEKNHSFQHTSDVGVHNIYLQLWIDHGLMAPILYVLLYLGLIAAALFAHKKPSASAVPNSRFLMSGVISMVGLMTAGMFENNFYDAEVNATLMVVFALTSLLIVRVNSYRKERV